MLQRDGSISFIDELLDLLDGLMAACEDGTEAPRSELEKGLMLTYALGVLQCEICALGDSLAGSPVFRSLHPLQLFEECCAEARDNRSSEQRERLREIEAKLRQRGWPTVPQESSL